MLEKRDSQDKVINEGKEERNKDLEGKVTHEEVISLEEVRKQMCRLKKKKAAGGDGLQNEVWIYGGRNTLPTVG